MKQNYLPVILLASLLFAAGCVPTRHLKGNERLLYKVKLNGVKNSSDKDNIIALYRQKPNRKLPLIGGMPYLSIYNFGKHFYHPEKIEKKAAKDEQKISRKIKEAGSDSLKIQKLTEKREKNIEHLNKKREKGNLLMRVGEPPALYDSALTNQTVSQINTYFSSKGFFRNRVSYQTKARKKKIALTFNVSEGEPYRFTELTTQIQDSAINRIYQQNIGASLLAIGQNYDEDLITRERDRLEELLRNQGYFEFRKQFVSFDVDTTQGNRTVQVATIIENPTDSTFHKAYTIRNIYFIEDAGLNRFGVKRDTVVHRKVRFASYDQRVSPRVLAKKVRFTPGQKFSMIRTNRTQRQLAELDVYRYVSLNYEVVKDSNEPLLDAYIKVMPAEKFQESTELGLNFSTFASASITPLPFFSERLKIRNVFGGAENMEVGVRAGFEGQPSTTENEVVITTELGANAALYFPQFLIPFSHREYPNVYNPRTRINTAFTYTDRPDYTRSNTEISLDYLWNRSPRVQFIVSPVDINLIDVINISPEWSDKLDEYEKQGYPLKQSFNTGIVTSLNAARVYNSNNIAQTMDAAYCKLFVEIGNVPRVLSGGALEWFPDWLNQNNPNYKAYSFAKGSVDLRKYIKVREKSFFVSRLNTGIASPIPNGTDDILPYDKFFFAGGGSSVRAWRPRKLGPGSFAPPFQTNKDGSNKEFNGFPVRDYTFEQQGEILIETNLEYRFKFFSFINLAMFLDAGNIWTIDEDKARPGAQFSKDFLSELAVGGGLGIRLDFSFLIIRFDAATKIFDPAEPKGDRYVLNRFRLNSSTFNSLNTQNSFNLGIGYPF